jgi:hypothetical protein
MALPAWNLPRGVSLGYVPQRQQIGSPMNAQALAAMQLTPQQLGLVPPPPVAPAAPANPGAMSMDQLRSIILGGVRPDLQTARQFGLPGGGGGHDRGGYGTSGREGYGSSSSARGGGFRGF